MIPFNDVFGKAAKLSPAQIVATAANVGVTFGFTVMVRFAVDAHCPALGVNVYVVVVALFSAGLQAPLMPFCEVVGSAFKLSPAQIGDTLANVGVIIGLTVMVNVIVGP